MLSLSNDIKYNIGNMSNPINIVGQEDFNKEVLMSEMPILVEFWAPWCGHCQAMGPVIDEVANDLEKILKVAKVDVEDPENKQLDTDYDIQIIPDMKLFKKGIVVKEFIAEQPKEAFEEELKTLLIK